MKTWNHHTSIAKSVRILFFAGAGILMQLSQRQFSQKFKKWYFLVRLFLPVLRIRIRMDPEFLAGSSKNWKDNVILYFLV